MSKLKRGKIIVIEGGDASGKATQAKLLLASLKALGVRVAMRDFPRYESATGKIVGGAYLGKSEIGKSFFKEGAENVDWRVASLYYAADRLYNMDEIKSLLDGGANVILDRYVLSNMAYQASKLVSSATARKERYRWLETLEYGLLDLPKPDVAIYLDVPVEKAVELMKGRKKDEHERSPKILRAASAAYYELVKRYRMDVVECMDARGELKSREKIAGEVLAVVADKLNIRLPLFEAKYYWD